MWTHNDFSGQDLGVSLLGHMVRGKGGGEDGRGEEGEDVALRGLQTVSS